VFPWESRQTSRSRRDRRRPDVGVGALESLERRELLAFSPIGFSLPDLTVSGFASPAASWGGPLTVTVNVSNLGTSTIIEPNALAPGSTSTADAPASVVDVYALRKPHSAKSTAVLLGTVDVPALAQNTVTQITSTITLPPQPFKFPGDGGKVFVVFVANGTGTVLDTDKTNDASAPVPLLIEAPLPELAVVGLDVPPVMQPGDTIQPNIRIANFGPADTLPQGPVQVALVASTTPTFNLGSSIIAVYTIPNIPGASQVASQGQVFGDANLNPALNVVTIAGNPVTLPVSPSVYFIGVVVDPNNQIKQLQKVPQFTRPKNPFSLSHVVGPPIANLPPAGVLVAGGIDNVPLFPLPFNGLTIGALPNATVTPAPFPPTTISASATTTSAASVITGATARATPVRLGARTNLPGSVMSTPAAVANALRASGLTNGPRGAIKIPINNLV
jgi:hypothetical protein